MKNFRSMVIVLLMGILIIHSEIAELLKNIKGIASPFSNGFRDMTLLTGSYLPRNSLFIPPESPV